MSEQAKSGACVIKEVCSHLTSGALEDAAQLLRERYPFDLRENAGRKCTLKKAVGIFVRDGFIDRYSGRALLLPGALRIISVRLPDQFPYHPNGKTDECHFAYWELMPTIDHVIPASRGGKNDETNWVTTSMKKNSEKANYTLEELGWTLSPPGDVKAWDGQMSWFLSEVTRDPALLKIPYILRWAQATRGFLAVARNQEMEAHAQ